ncbi:MAG TPA: hypothetical protein PK280_03730 [Planctomycetota bacterium]|nr:hypothetical protein [Planctomycetota bacterium]
MNGTTRTLLCAMFLGLLSATASAWEVPLSLEERGGVAGLRPVTSGVPLLVGQAKDVKELRLLAKDASGKATPIPAQFRELARWWRADASIRWVLVDFQTEMKPGEKQTFFLTNDASAAAPAPKQPVSVEETADAVTVVTGPARFVISKKNFTFLQAAAVDADGDGKFSAGEELLATTPDCGSVLEDNFGQKYYSAEKTRSVEVLEKGAMRVRVRARGTHTARDGKGYGRGMYGYDCMMDFRAGSAAVAVDLVIGNNFAKSIGTPCFDDASLWLKLASPAAGCSILGDKEHAGPPPAGGSLCLYQDSNGADTWKKCQGYNTERKDYWEFPEGLTASFKGYKVWKRADGKDEEAAAGNQARGTVSVATDRGGMVLHLLNFWQQFPKGAEVFADGRVRLALFPREYKVPHFLEDASAKGHEIVVQFFAKGAPAPEPAKLATAWDAKLLVRPELAHIAACGALADVGPFTVPTQGLGSKPENRTEAYGSRMLTDDGLYGNAYGWQIFGERWRSCGGHSTRGARQPMNEDNYLYLWLVTGSYGWLQAGDARSRQFRDVRCYRIEDQDPFSFKNWEDWKGANRSEEWTNRPQPKDADAKKYEEGRYPRSTFWFPNPEHCVLDLPYDRYLLMGDQRSFENLPIIAGHGGYYAAYQKQGVHRATGWSWRACLRYWELTGDKNAERLLKDAAARFKAMTAPGPIQLCMSKEKDGSDTVNWWFSYVFSRAAAMDALHTGNPDSLEVCKSLAESLAAAKEKYKGYNSADYAELHAVLWHLTGDEKYKTAGLGADGGENLKRVYGTMKLPACAHWLLTQPPKAKK